jgi:beta-lactamase superfamily II metal-dependent hydrolase
VIDGGFSDTGADLVNHIKTHYKTDRVDCVINTHPDNDHSAGLAKVLEELKVDYLAMHRPWKHTNGISDSFKDGRVTDNSISEVLQKSLNTANDLEQIAIKNNIKIVEPFAGVDGFDGALRILGPTQEYYEELLPSFRNTPEPKHDMGNISSIFNALSAATKTVAETFGIETLDDSGETSAENNTSAIILLTVGDECMLFTGDAGIPALEQAIELLENEGFDFSKIKFIHVPHHGSKRNIGPKILDKIVGVKRSTDQKIKTAFVSAPKKGDPKHPAKKVTNALRRRGAHVYKTNGNTIHHRKNSPDRGWSAIKPIPFHDEVDE